MSHRLLLVLFLAACTKTAAVTPDAPAAAAPAPAAPADAVARAAPAAAQGLDVAGIDRSVSPGDDFFRFANGTWLKTTEIPPDRSAWGAGSILSELTAKRTAELITDPARASAPAGTEARKVGDYYASFMDEEAI